MSISKPLRFEVFRRDSFTCQYCGAKPPDTVLEVDHVHPRSLGGPDALSNLKTACWNCNRGKAHIPLLPTRVYTLQGGPAHGQKYEIQLATEWPMLWVMQRHDGELAFYEDQFHYEEDGQDWGGQKLRFGHPGFGMQGQPHTGALINWSMRDNPEPRPVLLGVYWVHDGARMPGMVGPILEWATPELLIVELTS